MRASVSLPLSTIFAILIAVRINFPDIHICLCGLCSANFALFAIEVSLSKHKALTLAGTATDHPVPGVTLYVKLPPLPRTVTRGTSAVESEDISTASTIVFVTLSALDECLK